MTISAAENSILALQVFQVAFLLLHDWVPLGRLSDPRALRTLESTRRIVLATALSGVPFLLGLIFSTVHAHDPRWPGWVRDYLWISYGILFFGELESWWVPYLWRAQPARAARYKVLFGNTHTTLPVRNGIAPNTLHVVLHAATLATLVLLFWA